MLAWESPVKLWDHQVVGVSRLVERRRDALFIDPGCGKTLTAITAYVKCCYADRIKLKAIVFCPSTTVRNWERECARIMPDSLLQGVQVVQGDATKRKKLLADPSKFFFIINLDAINSTVWPVIFNRRWDLAILDESHKFRNPAAKRTKKMMAFSDFVKFVWILSGTPIVNSAMDIWSQFRIFDGGKALSKNFYVFRAKYFEDKNAGMPKHKYFPSWQPRNGAYAALQEVITSNAYRVKKEDCLDLPPLVFQTIYVDMTREQSKLYQAMNEFFVAFLEETRDAIVADLAITKMLRLQQISAGVVSLDSGETRTIECAKLEALEDLLETICPNHKVVIWTNFTHTYKIIEELCCKLCFTSVMVTGKQTADQKQKNIAAFRDDPKVRVAICNQRAAGTGTDGLQVASYSIYYSKNFDLESDMQSQERTHRGGSEVHSNITRIDILTKGTIDEQIHEALRNKASLAELLLTIRKSSTQGD